MMNNHEKDIMNEIIENVQNKNSFFIKYSDFEDLIYKFKRPIYCNPEIDYIMRFLNNNESFTENYDLEKCSKCKKICKLRFNNYVSLFVEKKYDSFINFIEKNEFITEDLLDKINDKCEHSSIFYKFITTFYKLGNFVLFIIRDCLDDFIIENLVIPEEIILDEKEYEVVSLIKNFDEGKNKLFTFKNKKWMEVKDNNLKNIKEFIVGKNVRKLYIIYDLK